MTDTLKFIITLAYLESKQPSNDPRYPDLEPVNYSYDELASYVVRSKAAIHDAILEKEMEVKALIEKAQRENSEQNNHTNARMNKQPIASEEV